jgi:hypothetical protein
MQSTTIERLPCTPLIKICWPFSTVRKRVHDNECNFFAGVYESLRRSVEETYAD